jgi:hAT family C-terminal dimerisation region
VQNLFLHRRGPPCFFLVAKKKHRAAEVLQEEVTSKLSHKVRICLLQRILFLTFVTTYRWTFKSKLIFFILEHRDELIHLFDDMSTFNIQGFTEFKEIQQAKGFLSFLKTFMNVFLLNLFGAIFERTDQLYKMLQKKHLDITYSMNSINSSIRFFEELKSRGFTGIWDASISCCVPPSDSVRSRGRPRGDGHTLSTEEKCREIMNSVLTVLIEKMTSRFENFESLKFVELLCCDKFESYSTVDGNFPQETLDLLEHSFPDLFDIRKLKAELSVIYSDPNSKEVSLIELHERLGQDTGLRVAFKETLKLCQLVICLPSTSVSAERAFSAMRRIKTYLRTCMLEDRFSCLGFLSIEREYIAQLYKDRQSFYDSVISEYVKKNRRADFEFR